MTTEMIAKEEIDVAKIIPVSTGFTHELSNKLSSAQRLGNEFKAKAVITFNTIDGPKKVDTTVWSATEKYIQLKNNLHIPVNAIIDIEF